MKHKIKLFVILGVEFVAIAVMLILIFAAGKQQYTVTFDINGGTLISGSLHQTVAQGGTATPPNVVKEGHYLRGWSGNYRGVTGDSTVVAIWEYETTPGIEYSSNDHSENKKTYSLITGCFKNLTGDVYIGAYHDNLQVLGISDEAFKDCTRIENIFMLDGILTIGNSAFENCHSLDNVVLPSTTLTLGNRAFASCESLTNIVLPADLEDLGDYAFSDCEKLATIDIPDGVKVIGDYAFKNCESLVSVSLPAELEELGEGAFIGCSELTEIHIPATIKYIGDGAFDGCEKLEKIIFEEAEEAAEDETTAANTEDAESGSEDEEELDHYLVIGNRTFAGCIALTEVELPSTTLAIGAEAFKDCAELESVILPEGLIYIGDAAFAGCESLTEVTLPESLEAIGSLVFDTEGLTVKLPFTEEEMLPKGWSEDWCTADVTVSYAEGAEADENESLEG